MIDKNFNFRKSLGQNFLNDDNIINKIVSSLPIDKDTLVIEIGPGSGVLTSKLAYVAGNVLAYEIDTRLESVLRNNLCSFDNVDIKFQDFLKADVVKDIKEYNYRKLYVVANLPYYITTPIINKLITDAIDVSYIVVMIQKEVADRFCAVPGNKDYNSLTVYLNYHFEVKKLFDVSKNSFIPKPKVDSTVICLKKRDKKQEVCDLTLFYKLVRDSFCFKRKNLRNNLKGYDLLKVENVLKKYGYDLSVRAEQLDINIFVEMANKLKN